MGAKRFNEQQVAEFCAGGKSAEEIAKMLKMSVKSIHNPLAKLQMEGRIYKAFSPDRYPNGVHPVFYVQTGTELTREFSEICGLKPIRETVYNDAFIAHAHNWFGVYQCSAQP